ncbi:MAG TPA: ABC transporter substrate binding protein [Myxococcales bacterium]
MAAAVLLAASPAFSAESKGEALVVLGAEVWNYRALADGFAQGLGGARTLVASSADFATELKAELGRARIVLAVSPVAVRAVMGERPAIPVLLAFVGADQASPDARALVIPVVVPPAAQVATIRRSLPSIRDVPRQARLGVLYDPAISSRLVAECEAAATAAGFTLVKAEVRERSEVAHAARDLLGRAQALWLIPDATVVTSESFRTLMQLSLANRVPLVGFSEAMAKAGAVLAIQPNYGEIGKSAGQAAKRILEGAPPALKPPEALAFMNAKAASLLEIELPEAATGSAARVFE